jgi:succinate-semialdehyde dehydrogenase/glutarate-semialdehyde dehydrogenase
MVSLPFSSAMLCTLARTDPEINPLTSALMALKFRHAGQACITSNRIYVQKDVYNEFAEMLIQRVTALKIGHGMDKMTTMGPVTTPAGLDKIASQIEDAKMHGATVLTGGQRLDKMEGYFFEPTIIKDAGPDMLVSKEETFGPLLAIFPFETEAEAVEAANNTSVSLFHPLVPFLFLPKLVLT